MLLCIMVVYLCMTEDFWHSDMDSQNLNIYMIINLVTVTWYDFLLQKMAYVMQGAFIPFLKNIVETELKSRDAILSKLIDIMWGLMEVCVSYISR